MNTAMEPRVHAPQVGRLEWLPAVHGLDVVLRALEPVHLPPLFTTAVHGALFWSLKGMVCVEPARTYCTGCPREADCAYPALAEPALSPGDAGDEGKPGARVALPLVMAPREWAPGRVSLEKGDAVAFRLTLVGSRAHEQRRLLVAAMEGACQRGMGAKVPGLDRPGRMSVDALLPVEARSLAPADGYHVTLVTPLRVKGVDTPASLDAEVLWAAMVRRARQLGLLYGANPGPLPRAAPFSMGKGSLRVTRTARFSARQGKRMEWSGLVGTVTLQARGEAGDRDCLARLLAFSEAVQLGKGTAFGFGALAVTPDA